MYPALCLSLAITLFASPLIAQASVQPSDDAFTAGLSVAAFQTTQRKGVKMGALHYEISAIDLNSSAQPYDVNGSIILVTIERSNGERTVFRAVERVSALKSVTKQGNSIVIEVFTNYSSESARVVTRYELQYRQEQRDLVVTKSL